ncbi:hypothetical protein OAS43_00350 [Candidatus Pelagibacter sp.]|nr:hypothetical protein [Candidatus Pelagibacter sp.]
MKKLFINLLLFFFISNCASAPGTALLGPVLTGAKTGSIAQASLSYSSNKVFVNIKEVYKKKKNSFENTSAKILNNTRNKLKNPPILLALSNKKITISDVPEPEPLP